MPMTATKENAKILFWKLQNEIHQLGFLHPEDHSTLKPIQRALDSVGGLVRGMHSPDVPRRAKGAKWQGGAQQPDAFDDVENS